MIRTIRAASIPRTSNQHPGYTGDFVVCFAVEPLFPNLISQYLINQQGFDVDFGEHGGMMTPP